MKKMFDIIGYTKEQFLVRWAEILEQLLIQMICLDLFIKSLDMIDTKIN